MCTLKSRFKSLVFKSTTENVDSKQTKSKIQSKIQYITAPGLACDIRSTINDLILRLSKSMNGVRMRARSRSMCARSINEDVCEATTTVAASAARLAAKRLALRAAERRGGIAGGGDTSTTGGTDGNCFGSVNSVNVCYCCGGGVFACMPTEHLITITFTVHICANALVLYNFHKQKQRHGTHPKISSKRVRDALNTT